jgi:hypothetical protein
MTAENDLVLIYIHDKPVSFARVENIEPDHKRGWYHVRLLMLQIPVQVVTWILRDVYIDGESFTMDGNHMRIEKVTCPHEEDDVQPSPRQPNRPATQSGNVISLADLKKK